MSRIFGRLRFCFGHLRTNSTDQDEPVSELFSLLHAQIYFYRVDEQGHLGRDLSVPTHCWYWVHRILFRAIGLKHAVQRVNLRSVIRFRRWCRVWIEMDLILKYCRTPPSKRFSDLCAGWARLVVMPIIPVSSNVRESDSEIGRFCRFWVRWRSHWAVQPQQFLHSP